MKRVLFVLSALALVLVGAAMAGDTGKTTTKPAGTLEKGTAAMSDAKAMTAMATTGQLMKLADLKWQDATGYAAGVKVAHVMTGPQEIGIVYLKFPAGTKVAAHSYPSTQWGTVVSGTGTFGLGTDMMKGSEYAPGSFAYFPPKAVHWLTAKTETIIYANALGPEGIDYSNPNEDPRKAQASR